MANEGDPLALTRKTATMQQLDSANGLELIRLDPARVVQLFDECQRCMYIEAKGKVASDAGAPRAVDLVDEVVRDIAKSQRWVDLKVAPKFRISAHRKKVTSSAIPFAQYGLSLLFESTIDALLETIEGKTMLAKFVVGTADFEAHPHRYEREFAALAFAVEHPETLSDSLHLDGYVVLGFSPVPGRGAQSYVPLRWLPVGRQQDGGYFTFVRAIARKLSSPVPPPPGSTCKNCARETQSAT